MTASDHLSAGQFSYEHVYSPRSDEHTIVARHPSLPWNSGYENHGGHLSWFSDGEIGGVEVEKPLQRKGIATEMYRRAKEITPDLRHSDTLSPEGRAWAKAVGS